MEQDPVLGSEHLTTLSTFASHFPRDRWTMADLPKAIGAEVRWFRSSGNLLGLADSEDWVILLNERIRDTPEEPWVLGHEVGHLILRHGYRRPCIAGTARMHRIEEEAWYAAAGLAISTEEARRLTTGKLAESDILDQDGRPLPVHMVRLARAVHLSLGTPYAGIPSSLMHNRLRAWMDYLRWALGRAA